MSANANLHKAKNAKNDEFYTQLTDVSKELMHYKQHFKGKIVFCNCDDPTWSAFWKYFHLNFDHLGLKKLISTHYDRIEPTYKMEYEGGDDNNIEAGVVTPLEGNGDFRNQECIEILKESDIVVTNPPFSCYSSDTEVMTDKGWKLIKDVDIDSDIIMSLNPDTNKIEMVKAVDFISSPVHGELHHFHNRNMDFCVTGNHRMFAQNTYGKTLPLVKAEDIKRGYRLPLNGFAWEGKDDAYFVLPSTKQLEQYSRKEVVVPEKKIPMKQWLEFFGFYLADGCYRDHINTFGKRDYTVSIKQNESNQDYVLKLIRNIGFKTEISKNKTGNHNYNIYSKQLWEYLSQYGRSRDKYIPREFLDLDTEYLQALYTGYTNGDSSLSKDGQTCFSSVSETLMENIQELILKLYGRVTQIRKAVNKHSYDDDFGECYYINVKLDKDRDNFSKYGKADKVAYSDNVYCLTLEKNHIMLVRHKGVIGWCGNCFREYVAQLMEHKKKFLIIGNMNAITYKEIFPLIREDKMWVGANEKGGTRKGNSMCFTVPDNFTGKTIDVDGVPMAQVSAWWFTNLDFAKRHQKYIFWKNYNSEEYPKYDNYDAIDCGHSDRVPCDYDGVIGVPISFLNGFYNPEQFEIIWLDGTDTSKWYGSGPAINGKKKYRRLFIRKKVGA